MNKKWKLLVLFLITIVNTYAQEVGTKTTYKFSGGQYTPAPAGFEPVFVNYVGRHGARFLTKAGSDIGLLQVLLLAEKAHALTPKGTQLKMMVTRFLSIEDNNYENISLLGEKEQAGIGTRMYHNYAKAFKGHGLAVQITHKVRTRQSADAFLQPFATYSGQKGYTLAPDSGENVLRFYDLSPAYQDYKNSAALTVQLDSLERDKRTEKVAADICAKIFSGPFIRNGVTVMIRKKPVRVDAVSLMESIYDLYSVQFSIPMEMQEKGYTRDSIDFSIVLDKRAQQWLDFKNGAADFLEKGPGTDTLGIQVRVAAPLLVDFINSTDSAIQFPDRLDANLRFTHAEAISPFATLLGIPAASVPSTSVYTYNRHWKAASIIPLSANIQWIIYSNGKEQLVKVLLNEKEVALPVKTSLYPYYRWEDLRYYYLEKLKKIHADPTTDMHQYLLQLK
jgi:multiple inositol-polyphosphate phosphatase/2,3-bisphosphoglycerate 3-phosphatase